MFPCPVLSPLEGGTIKSKFLLKYPDGVKKKSYTCGSSKSINMRYYSKRRGRSRTKVKKFYTVSRGGVRL